MKIAKSKLREKFEIRNSRKLKHAKITRSTVMMVTVARCLFKMTIYFLLTLPTTSDEYKLFTYDKMEVNDFEILFNDVTFFLKNWYSVG